MYGVELDRWSMIFPVLSKGESLMANPGKLLQDQNNLALLRKENSVLRGGIASTLKIGAEAGGLSPGARINLEDALKRADKVAGRTLTP